jgi:hypothetical protein
MTHRRAQQLQHVREPLLQLQRPPAPGLGAGLRRRRRRRLLLLRADLRHLYHATRHWPGEQAV